MSRRLGEASGRRQLSCTPAKVIVVNQASDRQGLERLLRYCARPAFALERLREIDGEHLIYESVKLGTGGSVSLMLTRSN